MERRAERRDGERGGGGRREEGNDIRIKEEREEMKGQDGIRRRRLS